MASKKPATCWTPRDDEIAACLMRSIRTSEQLLLASQAFTTRPFESLRRVQERLAALARQKWVARHAYRRSIGNGSSYYYQLTLAGYRQWWQDAKLLPPTKRYFSPRSEPSHLHSFELARFWTATERFAAQAGYTIKSFSPEGAFCLTAASGTIKHDGLFSLVNEFGREFWVFVELDRSTERLTSSRDDLRYWEKVLRVYDSVQDHLGPQQRFRVWVPCSESGTRAENIAKLFGQVTGKPNRQLVLPFSLDEYLDAPYGLTTPIVRQAGRAKTSLLPMVTQRLPHQTTANLVERLVEVT